MADRSLIAIDGKTPAGTACAAILARAGMRSRVTGVDPISGGLALVSRSILEELGITGAVSARAIERVIERALSEDSAMDTTASVDDLVVVRTLEIAAVLLGAAESGAASRGGEPALRVDATEIRLGDSKLQDGEFLPLPALEQVVQLEWDTGLAGVASWTRMSGEPLRDVKGRASLIIAPGRTALILTVPTEALVESSIALPDVLSRFLTHPTVAAEIPAEEPAVTITRLLKANDAVHVTVDQGVRVRIGAAAGLADPVLLDREIRSGIIAGSEIAAANAEGRLTLARLSRISHSWAAKERLPVT